MHDGKRTPLAPKHLPQVLDQCVRPLPRRKVAAAVVFARQHERAERLVPQLGELHELLGELGRAQLDVLDVRRHPGAVLARALVLAFVVDALAGGGAGGAEPVDADPGQDLVVGPGVAVAPVVQLLVEPGEQADGRVGDGVADRLGFGALLEVVAGAFGREPFRMRVARFLGRGQRRLLCFEEEGGVGARVRVGGLCEVGVCGAAGGGVEEGHGAQDRVADVATLGHWTSESGKEGSEEGELDG